jgi:hypothetical protein
MHCIKEAVGFPPEPEAASHSELLRPRLLQVWRRPLCVVYR